MGLTLVAEKINVSIGKVLVVKKFFSNPRQRIRPKLCLTNDITRRVSSMSNSDLYCKLKDAE
jgi:hypothetical protein